MHTVQGCAELCFIMENKQRFEDAHQLMQDWEEGFYQEGREKNRNPRCVRGAVMRFVFSGAKLINHQHRWTCQSTAAKF